MNLQKSLNGYISYRGQTATDTTIGCREIIFIVFKGFYFTQFNAFF